MEREAARLARRGISIGLVPTMGYLHEGHASLIRAARKENRCVVVSIFVNPTQFGPKEDFKRYPRDARRDIRYARREKVNIVFIPVVRAMYPQGFCTYVTVEGMSDVLCGKYRPGHFRGVATVVVKLLNITRPARAYFGRKDAQQARIIQQMVRDLNVASKIIVCPTVREPDGLAMSSRNIYLRADARAQARVLAQALQHAERLVKKGIRDAASIKKALRACLMHAPLARIQYADIVDDETLRPLRRIAKRPVLIALAVRFGRTRLIDNVRVKP